MNKALARIMLVVALVSLYSISAGHNFLFDEENVILRNPLVKDPANAPLIFQTGFFYLGGSGAAPFLEYYRPFSVLSFMVDHYFWRSDPMGYNLTSALIHIFLALAFFELLLLALKHIPAAFWGALLFAIHPIHTEAVNHVSCRSETFSALFIVLSIIFYLRGSVFWVALFQVIALLSKESAVLMPVFLMAADVVFLKGTRSERIKRMAPSVLISVGYVLYRKYACPVPMHIESEALSARLDRVLTMAPALGQYFKTLVWPPYFQLFDSIRFAKGFVSGQSILTLAFYAIAVASLVHAWLRRSVAFMGLTLLFVGFAPYLQIVAFYPQWAEHFLTVPAMGFFFLCAIVLRAIFLAPDNKKRLLLLLVPYTWAALLGLRTAQRNDLYNELDRYYAVLSRSDSPYAVHGLHELAKLRIFEGDIAGAKGYLEEALGKDLNQDVTHAILGWCEANERRYEKALEHFDRAVSINPDMIAYQKDRASMLISLGRYTEASQAYAALILRQPQDHTLYRAAIASFELDGRPDRSLALGRSALAVFDDRPFEAAVLRLSLVRLSYRQGWDGTLKENLDRLLQDHAHVPWQGKVAQLLGGQMTIDAFTRDVLPQFAGFEDEARGLFLMAAVLGEDKKTLMGLMGAHQASFEQKAARDPLFDKEWQVAKKAAVSDA